MFNKAMPYFFMDMYNITIVASIVGGLIMIGLLFRIFHYANQLWTFFMVLIVCKFDDYETVEVVRGYCECGEDCYRDCRYSFPHDMDNEITKMFIEHAKSKLK